MTDRLPTVVASSVIRSAHKGDSHGGVYLVDLADRTFEQVLDWNDCGIDFEGRGGDRGLRGIAVHGDAVLLAASNEVFVFDREFRKLDSFSSPYLSSCHETYLRDDSLWLTSTRFDSVLEFDLESATFTSAVCIRTMDGDTPTLGAWAYDPTGSDGPHMQDHFHVNNVYVDDAVYLCGTGLSSVMRIVGERIERYAPLPHKTHNARPLGDGIAYNDTAGGKVVVADRDGTPVQEFQVPTYPVDSLERDDLGPDHARQGWGRGLAAWEQCFIAGSSPATVAVHDRESGETVEAVNLTLDVRNAIHGLEVWPFR